ncbi:DUF721 domain-containing protein [Crocinitomicaceae bacterium]|nr:DUF721 domain-containing protein [Crocinitomicaceae bacterium]
MVYNPDNRRSKKEQPLGDVIEKLMKAYQLDDKMKEFDLNDAWSELMGKAVAHRTKNIKIKNKTLHLQIDSAVMREELHSGKRVIIERVNQFMKKEVITDVWFS